MRRAFLFSNRYLGLVAFAFGCSSARPSDDPASAAGRSGLGGSVTASGGSAVTGGLAGGPERGGSVTSGGSSGATATGGAGVASGGAAGSADGGTSKGGRAGTNGGAANTGKGGADQSAGGGATSAAGATTGGAAGAGGRVTQTGGSASGAQDVIATIKNGGFWNDIAGKRIEAHGGGFIRVADTWYWIGEDKSANSGNFKAVNCYASKNLQDWEFKKAIITRNTATALAAADRIIERPKVIYNDTTKKFVMWLHWEGKSYAEAAAGVFTSDTVDGDYTFVRSFRPNANMSRDDTLFKDDDGKAYFASAANENADLGLYELTDDYLDIRRQLATLWPGSYREAPGIMKAGGRYFLLTSGATGWDSNQAKYSTATSMAGPWSALTNIGDGTTFDTQNAFLIPIQGASATTYIYASDRWQDPDLVSSKYVWLPLKVSGSTLSLAYYDQWQLNLTAGTWSVDDGYLPQGGWKLLFVDSEETAGEDGKASNAFDDSPSTYWHTSWDEAAAKPPHEIQIDLGAEYQLTALRYLPRQDKDDHGMVADYQFFVGEDPKNWGTAVANGTFNSDRKEKVVTFTQARARYVRFVATSEINGGAWTSIAELDLVGKAD
jgi:hypothetical protein